MNRLFLLRGAPGCGKSTWVADNGFEDITVSSDQFRIDLVGFDTDENGEEKISQANPGLVWGRIRNEIEHRMSKGEDVILDSTALNRRDMNAYGDIVDEYGYEAYVVDFWSWIDEDTCMQRNAGREGFRIVPEFVIERFYSKVYNQEVPDFYTIVMPDEAADILAR